MSKRAIRKANRSGGMACPICNRVGILVEHHIHGREVRNANHLWNIVFICGACHDEVHTDLPNRIIIIDWFKTTKGKELIWHRKNEPRPEGFPEGASPPIFGES